MCCTHTCTPCPAWRGWGYSPRAPAPSIEPCPTGDTAAAPRPTRGRALSPATRRGVCLQVGLRSVSGHSCVSGASRHCDSDCPGGPRAAWLQPLIPRLSEPWFLQLWRPNAVSVPTVPDSGCAPLSRQGTSLMSPAPSERPSLPPWDAYPSPPAPCSEAGFCTSQNQQHQGVSEGGGFHSNWLTHPSVGQPCSSVGWGQNFHPA